MPQEQPDKVVNITMRDGLPVPDQDPVESNSRPCRPRFTPSEL